MTPSISAEIAQAATNSVNTGCMEELSYEVEYISSDPEANAEAQAKQESIYRSCWHHTLLKAMAPLTLRSRRRTACPSFPLSTTQ